MTEYKITRLGHLGEGIADGPVYAPLTLPGEVITAEAEGDRLHDIRVVQPSDDRVKPPCRHFKSCGGCSLQHASDALVANWKIDVVTRALRAQEIDTIPAEIATSPAQSRRRAVFSARRTKKGASAGFHARASDTIVEVPDCILLDPKVLAGRDIAAELAKIGASRKGEIAVTVTKSLNGLDIHVSGGKPLDRQLQMDLAGVIAKHNLARLSWSDEIVGEAMPPHQPFGKAKVAPPPGAFLQATEHGEASLLAKVKQAVGDAKLIADLFAGSGTFSLPLAELGEVRAYESVPAMISALDRGWRTTQGIKRVQGITRDLFRDPLVAEDLNDFDAVVLDPPRAGAKAQSEQLAMSDVPVIAFVSCNPVTFARDARILINGGYNMEWITVVDQFRWSPHIELIAKFVKVRP